jgi:hypothetical protein
MSDMAADGDIRVHETTYKKFMRVFQVGAVICFVIAGAVVFVITR